MLRYLLISVFSIVAFTSCDLFENEQGECETGTYFLVAPQMPVLEGGLGELQQRVVYPPYAITQGIEGRVVVQFIVTEEGNVACPQMIRGIGGGCDQAAVDAVSEAKFTPGEKDGKPVRIRYSLPIVFRLEE